MSSIPVSQRLEAGFLPTFCWLAAQWAPFPSRLHETAYLSFNFRLAKNSRGVLATAHYLRTVTPVVKRMTQPNAANSAACGGDRIGKEIAQLSRRGM
jgi:hypothetical protein